MFTCCPHSTLKPDSVCVCVHFSGKPLLSEQLVHVGYFLPDPTPLREGGGEGTRGLKFSLQLDEDEANIYIS